MWRRLIALTHPDRAEDSELFVWTRSVGRRKESGWTEQIEHIARARACAKGGGAPLVVAGILRDPGMSEDRMADDSLLRKGRDARERYDHDVDELMAQ